MEHDHSKLRKQRVVSVETLEANTVEGIQFLQGIFGDIIEFGTSTPYAKLGSLPVLVSEGTRLHIVQRIKMVYIHNFQNLSITVHYQIDTYTP
jgi:hypothetical protein